MPSGSTRGRCAAPARACWCRKTSPSASSTSSRSACSTCASAIRWINASTWAPSSTRPNGTRSTIGSRWACAKAASCSSRDIHLPERGLFYRPTLITGLEPAAATVQEEIFGPVLVSLTFRTPGGSDRPGQQHPLRAGRQRVEREHQPGAGCGQQDQGRLGVGELHQPVRCRRRFWRLPRERLWPRRRPRRAVRVPAPGLAGSVPDPNFTPPAEGDKSNWGEHIPDPPHPAGGWQKRQPG